MGNKLQAFAWRVTVLVLAAFFLSAIFLPLVSVKAFTSQNLAEGSVNNDVFELQGRLQFLGYYHGKVDGTFGKLTYWAVKNFQSSFGLPVTGFVNMPTKIMLVKATSDWHSSWYKAQHQGNSGPAYGGTAQVVMTGNQQSSSQVLPVVPGLTAADLNLMAHVVYAEARGEPFDGEVAVAAVVLNRLHDPKFPHTIPGIIYQPGAFTSVNDGQINLQPNQQSMNAVMDAVHGWDPSHGALYYFNPSTSTSTWIWSKPEILQIGHHIFCS
ncbi:spore cortex-lytic enzyme [Alicyclobacillaceae bacterium I2511]|nr:spore cortex-lytic enzyme [Alicyclobacillaceae bacterium I2511]